MNLSHLGVGSGFDGRENWQRLKLDPDSVVVGGSGPLLPVMDGTPFFQLLTDPSRKDFLRMIPSGEDSPGGGILLATDGTMIEVMVTPSPTGYNLYYRRPVEKRGSFQRLEFFYRHFVTSQIGICITDPKGNIVDANPHFLGFYGYTLDELIGQNPRILKSGRQSPEAYKEMWQKISDPAIQHWSGEMINRRKNAEEVIVAITISAVRNAAGVLMGFVASTLDVTARKQMEKELRASNEELLELNRLKTDLMAITSHDLKSPLHAIISRARMLIELGEEFPAQKRQDALTKIVESGEKMTTFIGELLDLEKMEAGRYQLNSARVHLDTVLQGCVDTNLPTATEKGIVLALKQRGESGPLRADFLKLEQAFNNIISNAIRYTPRGGTITVTFTEHPGKPKRVEIADTGPGIPEKDLPFIFDRYYQARVKGGIAARVFGAGLGLSIVKKIMDLHDGKVWVANGKNGGCTFTLEFPEVRRAVSGQDLAAMIVDPQQEIYGWLEAPLKKAGVSCFMARNVFEAKRIAGRERPELVFAADQELPEQLRSFVAGLTGSKRRTSVATTPHDQLEGLYHHQLLTPVIDIELFELVDDLLSELGAPEDP
ncbi:PAS domain-containing sensor histidine kinase [Geomonas sp. Red32]|uniref:PAS domain-containing sensor histidine kinase n=1 Tax=Geomonas sp. Red32 TaxID=2912856 RepID=UPI00202CC952|nr:PAS domain-containing sensor histidine kinase [Geomonas sp. Red32]MCM0082484.1 PAS domain-containing sensor histidine kinase [Geomonas sp. Red32]